MNENIKNLVKLITENPNLKVLPMVDSDLLGEDYSRYCASFGKAKIDEVYYQDERIYFRSEDEEELFEEIEENIALDNEDLSEDEIRDMATNEVEEYWQEVIIVEIDLP